MPKPLISVGALIDRSWDTYRAAFAEFVSISGLLLSVVLLNVLALSFYPLASTIVSGASYTPWETAGMMLFWAANTLVAPLIALFTVLAMSRLASARLQGKNMGVKAALASGKERFWGGLVTVALLAVVLMGALALAIVPGAAASLLAVRLDAAWLMLLANLVTLASMIAAAVLAVRWIVRYAFSVYAAGIEGVRGKAALHASEAATRGRFWSVLLRLAVPNVVFLSAGVLLSAVLSVVAGVAVSAAAGLNTDVYLRLLSITDSVFPAVAAMLVNPLIVIANTIVYRDLKGEG